MKYPNNHSSLVVSILLCLVGSVLLSCQEGDLDLSLPIPSDQMIYTRQIDTMTVSLSTVFMDTVLTSSSGAILAGRAVPLQSGIVTAQGYFQLDPPPTLDLTTQRIRFDSLVLYMGYAASYGDTTQSQTLRVHALSSLPSETRVYSNRSVLAYEPVALAHKTFRARPTLDSVLAFRLPNAMGLQLLDLLTTNTYLSQEMINQWNYGLTLVPGSTDRASVLTFDANTSYVRLYYREESTLTLYSADLSIRSATTQFNSIQYTAATNQAINLLTQKGNELSSSANSHEAIFQTGVGLHAKLEIPFIHELKKIEGYAGINRVLLDIKPIRKSLYDNTPPLSTLTIQVLNRSNQLIGSLLDLDGNAVTASYSVDLTQLTLSDQYTFDLTDYFINVMDGNIENKGLLISLSSGYDTGTLVQGVSFGDRNHTTDKLQLRVFYTAAK